MSGRERLIIDDNGMVVLVLPPEPTCAEDDHVPVTWAENEDF